MSSRWLLNYSKTTLSCLFSMKQQHFQTTTTSVCEIRNLPWRPIQSVRDPLFNDSDRQAEKLPLWPAECKWQGWFMAVCNHVTKRPQRCWAGEATTLTQGDICTQQEYLTEGLWTRDVFVQIFELYSTSETQVWKHKICTMLSHAVKT